MNVFNYMTSYFHNLPFYLPPAAALAASEAVEREHASDRVGFGEGAGEGPVEAAPSLPPSADVEPAPPNLRLSFDLRPPTIFRVRVCFCCS